MAESVVSPIIETLLGKLRFFDNQKGPFEQGVNKLELKELEKILSSIRAILLDAEQQQFHNHRVRGWLKRLKDACYDAEDVLEELEIEARYGQLNLDQYRSITKKVCDFISCSKSSDLHSTKINKQVEEIRKKLDMMRVDMSKFNFKDRVHDANRNVRREIEMTQSFVEVFDHISERDKVKEDIITLTHEHHFNPRIVHIVGDGGIGKTTLAKMVYNDQRIESYFDVKLWASFPQRFVEKSIIIDMLYSATGVIKRYYTEIQPLQCLLQDFLRQEKYLLVLDDVLTGDKTKWNEFIRLFSVFEKGSTIIVTTSFEVGALTDFDGACTIYLDKLSNESSLSLFMMYAFEDGKEKNPNLIKIGEEIAKNCLGLPLVVKILARALNFSTDEDDWKYVNNNLKGQEVHDGKVLSVLKLGYDLLPHHLKRCFVYCSVFPKHHGFNNITMIQFWMAHGLLQPDDEDEEPEFVGMRYLNELRWRFFFQDFDQNFDFIQFKMHDLVYDLATQIAKNEQFRNKLMESTLYIGMTPAQSLPESCILNYPKLRALDLRYFIGEVLPESIGNLKHLRYLNLTKSKIMRLPHSISRLRGLETLLLGGCKDLEELPNDIRELTNLRMLVLSSMQTSLPEDGIGCLTSLRCLGIGSCNYLQYLLEDIGRLQSLRTLIIQNCRNLVSLPRNVINLRSLEKLMICSESFLHDLNMDMKYNDQELEGIKPHLRMLCIVGLRQFHELPQWLLQCSANTLQWLSIKDCPKLKPLPAEHLQILKSLEVLEISACPGFSSLPQEMNCLTALRELKIRLCPNLSSSIATHWPVFSHIPKIDIDFFARKYIGELWPELQGTTKR